MGRRNADQMTGIVFVYVSLYGFMSIPLRSNESIADRHHEDVIVHL